MPFTLSAFLSIASLLLSTTAVQSASAFEPVPLHQFALPSNVLAAEYAFPDIDVSDTVHVKIDTDHPALNLDNVPGLRKIGCSGESLIRVVLDDTSVAKTWLSGETDDQGLLVLINPKWGCGGHSGLEEKAVARKVRSLKISPNVVYLYTKPVALSTHAKTIVVELGSKEGYSVDWQPAPNTMLFNNQFLKAECVDCAIKGALGMRMEITPPKYMLQMPTVNTTLKGNLDAKTRFKFSKSALKMPQFGNRFEIYRQSFQRFEVPGLLSLDPSLIVTAGVDIPESPLQSITTGFSVQTNQLDATHTKPEIKVTADEFSVSPRLRQESDFTVLIDVSPRVIAEVTLFDKITVPVGVGLQTFVEGNIQTGAFAVPDCTREQSKLSLHVGVQTMSYLLDETPKPFGIFAKQQVYHTCKEEHPLEN